MSRARIVAGILLLGAAVLVATRARAASYDTAPAGEGDSAPMPTLPAPETDWSLSDWIDHATTEIDTMPTAPTPSPDSQIRAFLQAIAWCEGTAGQADPYRVCYGYSHVVQDLREHPAVTGEWKGERLTDSQCRGAGFGPGCVSTAAGKFQLIKPTWIAARDRLGLRDFSAASQDAAAIQLLRQCGAYDRIISGDLIGAIARARGTWASLPGANYAGQGMRSQAYVAQAFRDAGGVLGMNSRKALIVAGVVAAGLGLWYVSRRISSLTPPSGDAMRDASSQAIVWLGDTASNVFTGAIQGAGELVGIPRTDMTQCERDKAAGNWGAASFSCPATDYIPSAVSAAGSAIVGNAETPGVFPSTVISIGSAVGIPRTNMSKCEQDKAAGRWLDASFSCTAGDFLSSGARAVFGSTTVSQAEQARAFA